MKVGVIADIHGNHRAFEAVMSFLRDRTDKVLFAGDLVGYYPFVHECLEQWDHDKIMSVRGNHDQVLIDYLERKTSLASYTHKYGCGLERSLTGLSQEDLKTITAWPVTLSTRLDNCLIKMLHGSPWDELNGRVYPDFPDWQRFDSVDGDLIIMGHTHYPFVKEWKGKIIMNPGALGQPRNCPGPHAYCAVVDAVTRKIEQHCIPYDANDLILDANMQGDNSSEWARYLVAGKKL